MKRIFSIAASLAIILLMSPPSLARADVLPAHVLFTTDAPCAVVVPVLSYTNPANQPGQSASGATPWTLDTYPLTSVIFVYPLSVVCNGTTYQWQSTTPGNPITSGASDTTTTVTGHYLPPDTTPPTLHLPANMTVEATGASGAVVTFTATADDVNPVHPVVTCTPASGSTFGLGTTTVNCSAADAAGNTANGSFTVTVQDTTPPTVTPPSNLTVEATSAAGAVVTYPGANAFDVVDGSLPATCTPASGSTFGLGMTTVNCSATDSRGNTGTASFSVTVRDSTSPTLTLPPDMTVEATSAAGAAVSFTVSATDLVDGSVPVTCLPASGSTFAFGTTTVNCSATDSHGNAANGSFKVTVVDTTLPILVLPADITVNASSPAGAAVTYTATANDSVDGSLPVTCLPASGSTFPVGSTLVNCSATDSHGNTARGNFTVTVVFDTTPPVWDVPASFSVEATGPGGAVVTYTASASDPDDAVISQSCSPASGSTFPLGTTTVNCTASDTHGNIGTASFDVTVVDTTPPTLSLPADITVTAENESGAVVNYADQVSAADSVDGSVPVTCSPESGSLFPIGRQAVHCSALDRHGNAASGAFSVAVQYAAQGEMCRGVPGHQILQPIDADGSSVFQQGSTVPAKFRVCGTDGVGIGTPGVVVNFRLVQIIGNSAVSDVDEAVPSTPPFEDFRFGGQQWIFDLSTKNLEAGNTYVYRITLNDGSTIEFRFRLK